MPSEVIKAFSAIGQGSQYTRQFKALRWTNARSTSRYEVIARITQSAIAVCTHRKSLQLIRSRPSVGSVRAIDAESARCQYHPHNFSDAIIVASHQSMHMQSLDAIGSVRYSNFHQGRECDRCGRFKRSSPSTCGFSTLNVICGMPTTQRNVTAILPRLL